MSVLDLDAIEASAVAASPGPWLVSQLRKCVDTAHLAADGILYDGYGIVPDGDVDGGQWMRDAAFIAAARAAVPVLVARVRELEIEVEHLRSLLVETVDIAAGYVAGRMAPKGVGPNANEQIANDTWRRVMEISGLIFSPGSADRSAMGDRTEGV